MIANANQHLPSVRNSRGRYLSGPGQPDAWLALQQKYGDGPTVNGDENLAIRTEVAAYIDPQGWQYCTLNAWLDGIPSEDDLTWKAHWFSEMPRLEESCGDHAFGNQFTKAFDELIDKGAPKGFTDWIKVKGNAKSAQKRGIAEIEGKTNVKKGLTDAANAVNPLSNPLVVVGIAAAIALIVYSKAK